MGVQERAVAALEERKAVELASQREAFAGHLSRIFDLNASPDGPEWTEDGVVFRSHPKGVIVTISLPCGHDLSIPFPADWTPKESLPRLAEFLETTSCLECTQAELRKCDQKIRALDTQKKDLDELLSSAHRVAADIKEHLMLAADYESAWGPVTGPEEE